MGNCFSCSATPLENDEEPLQQPQITHDELKNEPELEPPQQPQTQHGEIKNDGFEKWPFTHFFLSDLTTATKNFSSAEIISESVEEFSNVVYKGQLRNNLGFAAVKRLDRNDWPYPEQFVDEVQRLGELKHKRLVKLLGCCVEEDQRFLVAEFLPNDTLAKRLFNQKDKAMDWSMRLRVAYHIAEALEYSRSAGFAAYSNLSAYSVLFDKDDEVCLSCFGLIRWRSYDRTTQYIRGTVNPKKETYRFGILLLNLLTGMQITPTDAPEMINGKEVTELMDPNLEGKFSTEDATVVFNLASECFQCIDSKSLITKELVATLENLLTKTENPSTEMTKPQEEGASYSSHQQQEVPSFEGAEMEKQHEEA